MAEAATGNISVAKTRRILKLKKTPALGLNNPPGPPPSFLPGVQPVAAALPPAAKFVPSLGSVKLFLPSEPDVPLDLPPDLAPALAPVAQQALPVNIRKEMLEGENAVDAVRNFEQGLALQGDLPPEANLPAQVREVELAEKISKNPCDILYDPCTGDPLEINTIDELDKRIKNLKLSIIKNNPEINQFPPEIQTRLDLLIALLNRPEPPSDNLFQYTINGSLYEAYWDIVFALNLIDKYKRTPSFSMVNGKAEDLRSLDDPVYNNNPINYLESRAVNMGASGASDITFCYKSISDGSPSSDPCEASPVSVESCSVSSDLAVSVNINKPRFYFCSSKYYKNDDQKGVENFDIQKIYTAAKHLHIDYDVRIILLVKNKEAVDKKLRRAISKYIAEEASAVYGQDDLFGALRIFYDLVHQKYQGQITKETIMSILGIQAIIKPILKPRLHQYMAIVKIQNAVNTFRTTQGGSNKFLVGILPRGGKTYIAGGIVAALQPKRVVVLLGAKSETISQFTNDLFKYYQDFSDYEVIDVVEGAADKGIDPSKKYIFVMSVELYKTESSKRQILINLKGGELAADLFICDEAHLKQTTQKAIKELEEGTTKSATDEEENDQLKGLDQVIRKDVPVIYMTGTYIKPLDVFKIPPENTIIWEYQDIQEGKNIVTNQEYFKKNFGDIYDEAIKKSFSYGESFESIQTMYRKFPNLYLLSTQFTDDAKQAFLSQSAEGEKVGFPTISHLFQVKKEYDPFTIAPELWYTGFKNPRSMARLINYLSPRPEVLVEGEITQISSVMKRVDRIAQRIGDRLAFFTSNFTVHSQLWFLPSMQGHPLVKRMTALAGIIFLSPWYRKHFNVLAVSSSADWSKIQGARQSRVSIQGGTFSWACPKSGETLKDCLVREEALARKEGKGVVFLAQNMLHLGISLACVDIVVLLDAGEKVDERIQKMYRALTESTNKRGGFIIDLNYFRTVTAIMNYQIQTTKTRQNKSVYANSGLKEAFNTIIETYNFDDDLDIYSTKDEGGSSRIESETIPELQRMMQKAPTTRGDGITISEVGQALNRDIEFALKDRYGRELDTLLGELADNSAKRVLREEGEGVERAKENKGNKPNSEKKVPKLFSEAVERNPIEKRKAFMDIFKTALKIGIFGTGYKTLPDLLEGIKSDDKLQEIIYDTLIKRGSIQETVDLKLIIRLILAELDEIIKQKKNSSYSGMKEAFNAKDTRSNKFQEVLTYIIEHLAPKDKERHKYGEVFTPLTLVDEMLSKLPKDIWSKKDYRWLDPANGIGNFPIKAFIGQTEGDYTYPGLFEGLQKEIPDDAKRCKWIIENMLYMIDINGKNNLIARRLFEKLCPGADANIEQIDRKNGFLSDKPLVFNGKEVKEFDVVMGNPPFNKGSVRVAMVTNKTRKERKDLGIEDNDAESGFWFKFVEKALAKNVLKLNGFLLFIHPITWFKPDRAGAHDLMLSKQILNMRIYTDGMSKKLFGGKGEITVAYYLIENKAPTIKTKIIDMSDGKEEVKLNKSSIIIKKGNSIFQKIQEKAKLFGNGNGLLHKTIKQCNDAGQYKLITILEDSGEIKYIKSSVAHPDQHTPKVIVGGVPKPIVLFDKEGEYGLFARGQRHYFVGEDLDKINDYFKTKLSTFILKFVKFEQKFIKPSYYPDIRSIDLDTINDKTLADYFGFTAEECKEIDQMPDPIHPKADKIIKITCAQLKGEKTEAGDSDAEGGGRPRRFTRKVRRV
jgi:hypothetical protein